MRAVETTPAASLGADEELNSILLGRAQWEINQPPSLLTTVGKQPGQLTVAQRWSGCSVIQKAMAYSGKAIVPTHRQIQGTNLRNPEAGGRPLKKQSALSYREASSRAWAISRCPTGRI